MATLATGKSALSQVDRSRQLAAALQQMAMSFEPIAHPYQGLAKLAQAWAANQVMKAADRRESEIAKEQQQMLVNALSPVEMQIPTRETDMPVMGEIAVNPGDMSGVDVNTFGPMGSGTPVTIERPKSAAEMLQALPAEIGQGVLQDYLTQMLMAQSGITPQQLTQRQSDLYTSVGTRQIEVPGQKPFEAEVFREKRAPGRVGLIGPDGTLTPIDSQFIKGAIDKTQDIPYGTSDYADFEATVTEAVTALDQIDRLRTNIVAGGLTQKTAIGGISAVLDNFAASLGQLGLRLNRDQEGVMLDRGFYSKFRVTEADREKYSAARISEIERAWKRFSALDAENQQISIALAYTLARIADPGGRLSEMDVMNQMLSLGLDQPSSERRLAALASAERTFAKTIETRLFFARQRAGENAPQLPPGFENRINSILYESDQPLQQSKNALSALQDAWATASPEARRELERRFPALLQQIGITQ